MRFAFAAASLFLLNILTVAAAPLPVDANGMFSTTNDSRGPEGHRLRSLLLTRIFPQHKTTRGCSSRPVVAAAVL